MEIGSRAPFTCKGMIINIHQNIVELVATEVLFSRYSFRYDMLISTRCLYCLL